ncbi:hypothetical protein [Lewinella sp. W8]|uniref:hypothetical protein n=1 Tax=Lewinella sp. W8 TaxID=2528208 RepID=UPI001067277D|nr:hypothetical protein [Lewinella sp. W8]MTB50266.1 hypothetical protein [Lewinella sp. W8]
MSSAFKEIRDLVALPDIDAALVQLRSVVQQVAPEREDAVVQLTSRHNDQERRITNGEILEFHVSTYRAQVAGDLLRLVSSIENRQEDPAGLPERHPVDIFHAYTINREDQMDDLLDFRCSDEQCQFFILQGDDRHEHEHFFERVAHDLMGHFRDIDNPDLLNPVSVERLTPYVVSRRRKPEEYRQEILVRLYDKAGLNADAHGPLMDKTLQYFWENSPRVNALEKGDIVTVFFRLEDQDRKPELAAETVTWFIEHIRSHPLPESAPQFLFFFSFEFNERRAERAESVRQAVQDIAGACVISEFEKVWCDDVVNWLKRYRKVLTEGDNPRIFGESIFDPDTPHYMAVINPEIQRLINDYNEKLIS